MHLFVVRHGKAEKQSASGSDDDRRLEGRGRRQAAFLAETLPSRAPAARLILASPIVRAMQTAQLMFTAHACPLMAEPLLGTGQPVSSALETIAQNHDIESLMLVGHNPQLSELVTALLAPSLRRSIELRTGEAAILTVDAQAPLGSASTLELVRLVDDD